MSLFKWMFRVQWDAIRRQGQELEDAEHAMRELRTCLVLAKDARVEWEKRAVAAEKRAAEPTEPRPMSEAPNDTWLLLRVSYEESSQPLDVRKGVQGREGKRVWIDESGIPGAPDSAWSEWWTLPTTAAGGSDAPACDYRAVALGPTRKGWRCRRCEHTALDESEVRTCPAGGSGEGE